MSVDVISIPGVDTVWLYLPTERFRVMLTRDQAMELGGALLRAGAPEYTLAELAGA